MSVHSQQNHTPALVVLTTLFFMMGFITCMNDILIPHLKDIFDLTYVQAMLIQFCFFTAYAIMSIPMGYLVGKIGYKRLQIIHHDNRPSETLWDFRRPFDFVA